MRAIMVGAVAFILGAASSPRAAGDKSEALALLCQRWKDAGGEEKIFQFAAAKADRKLTQAEELAGISWGLVQSVACGTGTSVPESGKRRTSAP